MIATVSGVFGGRPPNTVLGVLLGWAYLTAGVVAVAVNLGVGMAGPQSESADFSSARMSAYLVLGSVLVIAAVRGRAKPANSLLGALYLLVGVILLFSAGADAQLLALNHPDQVVHLGSAALLFGVGRTQD